VSAVEWLKAIKVFESVIQNGSLSAAGRKLGLSPASVSRHINDLEDSLGVRVLNRTSRRLSLTEAGSIYYDKIEDILLQIADAENAARQLSSAPRGTLRVHSRMLVGHQYVVPALKRFSEIYPDIKFSLTMSNFPVDIVSKGLDVDIRIGKLVDSSLVARKLASSRRMLVASPEYLKNNPPIVQPTDLAKHSCLTYSLDLGYTVWKFRKEGQPDIEVPVTGFLESDSGQALVSAAIDGLGIALINYWAVRQEIAEGRLVTILDDYLTSFGEFENGIYAVFQKSRHLPLKIRVFVDFLTAEFKASLG
jgi:DNA-binding transcriptional LysR family regulator